MSNFGIPTVRVELFGNGDSDGYKCGKYGFNDIIDLYDAAMHHVVASGKKLILFGYSIGALMVPSLVNRNRESVLAAIIFDTMIFGPKDYFVKNKIRQDILRGIPKDKIMYNARTFDSFIEIVLDGKHSILDGDYGFFADYYNMVLNQEKDGVCRKYSDLKTEGLHYSAAFSGGDVAMMNMGSWFIATLISNLKSGEYDSSLCGNWGIVKYPHAEGVEPGSTLGTITGLAVTTATDTPDEAWDFVKWVSGEEGAKVMAETGNFPAIMTDEAMNIITSLDGFPQDEASKEALTVSNLYLEVPYAENVSEINSALDSYHGSIMSGEMTVEEGIAAMEEAVKAIKSEK